MTSDHHSEYLSRAVAALTPEGRARVDELLDELTTAANGHPWLLEFAKERRDEVDRGRTEAVVGTASVEMLSEPELDRLISGFITIRDGEHLDDVGDWANAVLQLLAEIARSRP